MTEIHKTAVVASDAAIGKDAVIGPYAIIEHDVQIGDGCAVMAHAVIGSGARLGKGCRVFPGAAVGLIPQDLKFDNEKTYLFVGDNTTIRECATLNRGTKASGETRVGSDCLLMAYSHVAHDCVLGDHVICANSVAIAGHVVIGSNVNLGGAVMVHQFSHIGDHAFVGTTSCITQDIVPFALVGPEPTRVTGINKTGLERRGFSAERISCIKKAYRILFRQNLSLQEALKKLQEEFPANEDVALLTAFVKGSSRGIMRMQNGSEV